MKNNQLIYRPIVFLLDVRAKNSYHDQAFLELLLAIKDHKIDNKNLTNA